jgi:hypothetical protein
MRKFNPIAIVLCIFLFSLSASGASFKSYTGKIETTRKGSFVKTVFTTSKSVTYLLSGSLLPELKNLQGAKVKIKGVPTYTEAYYKLQVLEIKEYQILTLSNGKKPWVGVIDGATDLCLRTEKGKEYSLDGPLLSILALERGTKIWLTGKTHKKGFFKKVIQPDAYGILRPGG